MNRRAWGWLGVAFAAATLAVVWTTATAPLLGSRLVNLVLIVGLCGAGVYCFRQSERERL